VEPQVLFSLQVEKVPELTDFCLELSNFCLDGSVLSSDGSVLSPELGYNQGEILASFIVTCILRLRPHHHEVVCWRLLPAILRVNDTFFGFLELAFH
jgi:hypothetical protein